MFGICDWSISAAYPRPSSASTKGPDTNTRSKPVPLAAVSLPMMSSFVVWIAYSTVTPVSASKSFTTDFGM